jgi:hypothetical protein
MTHGAGKRKRKRKREQLRIQAHHKPKKSVPEQEHTPKESESSQNEVAIMPEVPPAKPKAKESNQSQYPKTPLWKIILEVSGVAILAIYTLGTYLQWNTMGHTLRAEQRAWVTIKTADASPQLAEGRPIMAPISIVNTGKTPAKKPVLDTVVESVRNGDSPRLAYSFPHFNLTTGVVWPNDPRQFNAPLLDSAGNAQVVTPAMSADLLSGKSFIVVYGRIEYDDVFNAKHWTQFCKFYSYTSGNYTAEKCTDYNGIDDD